MHDLCQTGASPALGNNDATDDPLTAPPENR